MFHGVDPNAVIWLVIAVINVAPSLVAALYAIKANRAASHAAALTETVHIATNSMKDALVAASKLAALAEGREIGRAEGAAVAAAMVEGRKTAEERLPDKPPEKPSES